MYRYGWAVKEVKRVMWAYATRWTCALLSIRVQYKLRRLQHPNVAFSFFRCSERRIISEYCIHSFLAIPRWPVLCIGLTTHRTGAVNPATTYSYSSIEYRQHQDRLSKGNAYQQLKNFPHIRFYS